MKCCPKCFSDDVLSYFVESLSQGETGTCDFCRSENVPLFTLMPECELSASFERLFDVIVPKDSVDRSRTLSEPGSLIKVFSSTWNIFSFSDEVLIQKLLSEMFGAEEWFKILLDCKVVVSPGKGDRPLEEYSIFGSADWNEFSTSIMHKSRFFTSLANNDVFEDLLKAARSEWDSRRCLYRARIWTGEKAEPKESDFHEPPEDKASDGRMRPAGIPCVYTADSPETAAAEVRAGMHDAVAIATLKPLNDFEFVDLGILDDISPFCDVDCSQLIANSDHLYNVARELARPVRPSDSTLDYVPFQYLSEVMQSFGNEAIGYPSVMHQDGQNIACFSHFVDMFSIESIDMYEVGDLAYDLCKL